MKDICELQTYYEAAVKDRCATDALCFLSSTVCHRCIHFSSAGLVLLRLCLVFDEVLTFTLAIRAEIKSGRSSSTISTNNQEAAGRHTTEVVRRHQQPAPAVVVGSAGFLRRTNLVY